MLPLQFSLGPSYAITYVYYDEDKAICEDILNYATKYHDGNISITIKEILKELKITK